MSEVGTNCHKCNLCKTSTNHDTSCSKCWKYDLYAHQEAICQYISKKYFLTCKLKKGKYEDYKKLSLKYSKFLMNYDFF